MDNEETPLAADGKFRAYSSQVEKALRAFESSSEWPDLIAALGRLSRVLNQYSRFTVIPKKILVGKRLSQCLHPALPAGVHLKALECYDIIFKNIGSARLAANLSVYSSGIFPLLGPSAMTVKSPLFDIYEIHYLPLGLALRPAFVGMLQGLLPGLEEGAEFYGRTQKLLENLSDKVGASFFYTCLWQVMLQAPTCRPYGLAFLLNHVDKRGVCTTKNTEDSQVGEANSTASTFSGPTQLGTNINLVLNSMCAILGDSQVLVQRCALDFLLTCVPIHHTELLSRPDRVTLCAAALGCLLRRDMSLNRRLSNWLMGAQLSTVQLLGLLTTDSQPNNNDSAEGKLKLARSLSESENHMQKMYYEKFAKSILIDAVKQMIRFPNLTVGDRTASIRPFRIVTTLMDLANLGNSIIEDILFDLILYMHEEYNRLDALSEGNSSDLLSSRRVTGQDVQTTSTLFRDLQRDSTSAPGKRLTLRKGTATGTLLDDFLKTANLFFANLDSNFFWGFINGLLDECCGISSSHNSIDSVKEAPPLMAQGFTLCELCSVLDFVLTHLPIETYSDVPSQHLPKLIQHIIYIMKERCCEFSLLEIEKLLDLASLLFIQILQHTASSMEIHLCNETSSGGVLNANPTSKSISTTPSMAARSNLHQETELMLTAVENYRQFFEAFCLSKMCFTKQQVAHCVENMKKQKMTRNASQMLLNELAVRIPEDHANSGSISRTKSGPTSQSHLLVVFTKVCRMLVDMVSYPLSGGTESIHNKGHASTVDENIPSWLSCLLVSAVFVDNFCVKTVAMGALLDMLHATISLYGQPALSGKEKVLEKPTPLTNGSFRRRIWDRIMSATGNESTEPSTTPTAATLSHNEPPLSKLVNVAISFPTISLGVLRFLYQNTSLFRLMGQSLWHYMSGEWPQCHRQAVGLFLQLHKLTTQSTSSGDASHVNALCEDLVLSEMLCDETERALEGQARFLLIWHLQHQQQLAIQFNSSDNSNSSQGESKTSRSILLSTSKISGSFDKCLFVLLDGLDNKYAMEPSRQEIARKWLLSAVVNGELPHVLEPLLLSLLEAHSVRISFSTASNIWNTSSNNAAEKLNDSIYSLALPPSSARLLGSILEDSQSEMNDRHSTYRQSKNLSEYDMPPDGFHTVDSQIGLELEDSDNEEEEPYLIVNDIIGDLVNSVVISQEEMSSHQNSPDPVHSQADNNGVKDRPHSDSQSVTSHQSDGTSVSAAFSTTNTPRGNIILRNNSNLNGCHTLVVLPIHSHFYLYRQSANSFDWRRALYILGRTNAIFQTWPNEVVLWCLSTLIHANIFVNDSVTLSSGVTAKFPGTSSAIPGLMARHKQALDGGNFYQSTGAEQLASFRRMCYVECVLHLCLNYARSLYVPPGMAGLGKLAGNNEERPSTSSSDVISSNNSVKMEDNQLLQELRMGNRRVQLLALRTIHCILSELCSFLLSFEPLSNPTRSFPKSSFSFNANGSNLINLPSTIMNSKELRSFVWDMCVRLRLAPIVIQSLTSAVLLGVTNQALLSPGLIGDKDGNPLGPLSCFIVFWNEIGLYNTQWHSAYIQALLNLCLVILRLEAAIFFEKHTSNSPKDDKEDKAPKAFNLLSWEELPLVKYESNIPLANQSLCLSTIVTALRDPFQRKFHSVWFHFLLCAQPYWGRALVSVLPNTVRALTRCIRQVAWDYLECASSYTLKRSPSSENPDGVCSYPANYTLELLDCLQGLCHSIFLSQSSDGSTGSIHSASHVNYESAAFTWFSKSKDTNEKDANTNSPTFVGETRKELIRLLPRLILSLAFLWKAVKMCDDKEKSQCADPAANHFNSTDFDLSAKQGPLTRSACVMGSCTAVHHAIQQLLCPIAQAQTYPNAPQTIQCLLTATAGCWRAFSLMHSPSLSSYKIQKKTDYFESTDEQEVLVDMLRPLMTTDVLVMKITELVRIAAGMTLATAKTPLKVEVPRLPTNTTNRNWVQLGQERSISPSLLQTSLLHFIFVLCRKQTTKQLLDNYSIYLNLLKESVSCSLQPMGCFLLLKILGEFLSKIPLPDDKREQKELQDVSQRLVETVAGVAGSSLEQSSWFRRGVQVKVDDYEPLSQNASPKSNVWNSPSTVSARLIENTSDSILETPEASSMTQPVRLPMTVSPSNLARDQSILTPSKSQKERLGVSDTPAYLPHGVSTVQAFECLTEHMSVIFDMVYRSEERDRVASILASSVLPWVFPFLKLRSVGNLSNLRASSKLLASISSYQYTRKAWRKEAFDLLLEFNFFQFDLPTMRAWTTIVDNLMTQDKNTFKEALPRLTISGPGALNILFSREAEYDQRAACIKKLSFILFSSEKDQYVRFMPELQERLTECLRMGVVPQLYAQVFLCFRVLLMRISSNHLTSLWQNILRELMNVFQLMRQEYNEYVKNIGVQPDGKSSSSRARALTTSQSQKHLQMYLSACKLLDFALLMPEQQVPQFHFFKWVFVGDRGACIPDKTVKSDLQPAFKPYITELSDYIMEVPYLKEDVRIIKSDLFSSSPLLFTTSVGSLPDLSTFLVTLSLRHDSDPMQTLNAKQIPVLTTKESPSNPLSLSQTEPLETVLHHVMELDFIESLPK